MCALAWILFNMVVLAYGFVGNESSTPPNIMFIMVDDLGWNDIGYHGSEIRTPNLDLLANQGVKLENYYTAPVCGPTRAQFLSGKYSIHVGIPGNIIACRRSGLTTNVPTVADKLKDMGYATHMIGKWHAGFHTEAHLPTNRGFDTFRGHLLGHGDHYTHTRNYFGREYLDFHDNSQPYNQSWGDYSTEVFTSRAKELINQHNATDKPMFMFLSYQAPHNPLQVPDRYVQEYEHISSESRRNYAAMVTAIDIGVGEVIESLKEAGMYDNTVIIFTTDNGGDVGSGGSNFPLRGNKGSLYEGGVRSVGFVSSPLISFSNRSVTDMIHVTDWMPTLMHIAGGSGTSLDIDGVNQWNTIANAAPSFRREILHNIHRSRPGRRSDGFNTNIRAALTVWPWKILTGRQSRDVIYPDPAQNINQWMAARRNRRRSQSGVQLYNLDRDPSENINVALDNPSVVTQLLGRLKEFQQSIAPSTSGLRTRQCDPALRGGVWGPYSNTEPRRRRF